MTVRTSPVVALNWQTGVGSPHLDGTPEPDTTWLLRQFSVRNGLGSSLQFLLELVDEQEERVWPVWRGQVGAGAIVQVVGQYIAVPAGLALRFRAEGVNSSGICQLLGLGSIFDGVNPNTYRVVNTP